MIAEFLKTEAARAVVAQLGVSEAQLQHALTVATQPAPAEPGVTGMLAVVLAPSVSSRISAATGISEAVAAELERVALPAFKAWADRTPAYPAPASPCGVDGLL